MSTPNPIPSTDGLTHIDLPDFIQLFKGKHIFAVKIENNEYIDTLDEEGRNLHKMPWHYHANDIQECVSKLYEQNGKPFNKGVYFTVNELDRDLDAGRKRTNKMLENIRAVWADDDTTGGLRNDFPIRPNLIIKTSSPTEDFHKFQYIWLCSTTSTLRSWFR